MSKKRSKRAKEETKTGRDSFTLMSDILDKLYILDYEDRFVKSSDFSPLDPGYFAYPLHSVAEQFGYFAALCQWLLRENDHSFIEWNDFDDPNSISNNILQECRKLGFNSDFPSTKLRQGSGLEACQILDFLTTLLLTRSKYSIQPPVYHQAEESKSGGTDNENIGATANDSESDAQSMAEDIIESDADIQSDHEENDGDGSNIGLYQSDLHSSKLFSSHVAADDQEEKTTVAIMETQVDAAEWKLELERVSNKLEDRLDGGVKEWITHLHKSKTHGKSLQKMWPDATQKLCKHKDNLLQLLNRISSKEGVLNRQFESLAQDYTSRFQELTQLTQQHDDYVTKVSNSTSQLQELNEQIEDIKAQMESRNNTMTDMSPIRRLREKYNQLKNELVEMDLKIGVTRQALIHATMKHERVRSAR